MDFDKFDNDKQESNRVVRNIEVNRKFEICIDVKIFNTLNRGGTFISLSCMG